MTEIYRDRIVGPGAWMSAEIGGKEGLTRRFTADEIDAIDELLARTAGIPVVNVTRQDFSHPVVDKMMGEVRTTLLEGRGAIILSGLDLNRYEPDGIERLYWGLGTHIGVAAAQSAAGDRIGYVKEADKSVNRGYQSSLELSPHTDFHEVLGLMGIERAESGGLSGLASSLAIHNAIFESRPELLEPLYQGYHYGLLESVDAPKPVSDRKVPVFSQVNGHVSCMCNGFFIRTAARRLGGSLPEDLASALEYFYAQATRPDLMANFMLERGDILFWHNFTNLHSRTQFFNSHTHTRLLLRLWLSMPDGRPMVPEYYDRGGLTLSHDRPAQRVA